MRIGFFVLLLVVNVAGHAQSGRTSALTGQVSSKEEGPMEGVLVSAKRAGSTITVTVVSDREGRYSFPAAKLAPGRYALRIRAAGYDLTGEDSASVSACNTSTANLRLRKNGDLPSQRTHCHWIA